ncbi:hypothetical protein LWI29_036091 [Acer saccharum]|uniref:Uncharacterized protein n=1 Tax=Acer saccharum TaxID=4024 RepID=A0AA39RJ29_ACESA|nr:hypothetical protein LWI29_036091 [Acer saccharum]
MFLALMLGVLSSSGQLISPSQLEMFVDEIQDMPRIQGFHVVNGVSKSKSLKIGMFKKHWSFRMRKSMFIKYSPRSSNALADCLAKEGLVSGGARLEWGI